MPHSASSRSPSVNPIDSTCSRIRHGGPIPNLFEGYVNIPLGQIEKRLSEIPKDKAIITA